MYTLAYVRSFEPWLDARFWAKCAKGSDTASEIVHIASVFSAMTMGEEAIYETETEDVFDNALASCVPLASHFPTAQALLDALYENRVINERIWARAVPIMPREEYSALWKRGIEVPLNQLAHDAALFAVGHWNGEMLVRLIDIVGDEGFEYNSQDAASAMLLMWTTLRQGKNAHL